VLSLPERLRVKSKELLSNLITVKLNEDGALEELLVSTTKTNCSSGTVWCEESLDIELRAWLLIAKAFDIDGTRFCLCSWDCRIVRNLALDLFLAVCTSNLEDSAVSQCSNDSRQWLEALHASKLANVFN
jgi:hypothetical protein